MSSPRPGAALAALAPRSADDVRRAPSAVVGFSPAIAEAERPIKGFLETRMYRHERVKRVMDEAAGVVRDLFARYSAHPDDLPAEWSSGLAGARRGGARPPHRRFHRRHDRPLCAGRACAAF